MTRILKVLNIILISLTGIAYLAPYINPEKFWPSAVIGLLFPVLVIFNICFIIFWSYRKNILVLLSLVCLLLGFNVVKGVVNFGGGSKDNCKKLLIGTYNIGGLNRLNPSSKEYEKLSNKDLANFFENNTVPDIFCFQEITPKNRKTLQDVLNLPYFYQHSSLNTCIFSKYPIVNRGSIVFPKSYNSAVWIDIRIDDSTYRIFDMHLQSNTVKNLADKTLSSDDLEARKKYQGVIKIFSRIKNATLMRVEQAKQLSAIIRKSPYPVIVCGDLNDSSQSYVYETISQGLKDSFKESAFGFGATHNGKMPLLRIDYIFTSKDLNIISHSVKHSRISDHNPVFSKICLIQK